MILMSETEILSKAGEQISRWWLAVAIPVILSLVMQIGGWIGSVVHSATGTPPWTSLGLLLFIWILLLPSLLLLPVGMFLDTRRIRASEAGWGPIPIVWGMLGFVPLVSFAFTTELLALVVVVGGAYLIRRYTAIGFR